MATTTKRTGYSKCCKCGKSFATTEMQKKGTKKYCQQCFKVVEQEGEHYKILIDYIYKTIFPDKEPPKLIFKQIADLKEKYQWTYMGMLYALKWHYEIEKNPIDTDRYYGVGIIEYIYDDAKIYYSHLSEEYKRLENITFSTEEKKVMIDVALIQKYQEELSKRDNIIDISQIGGGEIE